MSNLGPDLFPWKKKSLPLLALPPSPMPAIRCPSSSLRPCPCCRHPLSSPRLHPRCSHAYVHTVATLSPRRTYAIATTLPPCHAHAHGADDILGWGSHWPWRGKCGRRGGGGSACHKIKKEVWRPRTSSRRSSQKVTASLSAVREKVERSRWKARQGEVRAKVTGDGVEGGVDEGLIGVGVGGAKGHAGHGGERRRRRQWLGGRGDLGFFLKNRS